MLAIPQVWVFSILIWLITSMPKFRSWTRHADVLELLGCARSSVCGAHGQDLVEAAVEDNAFQYTVSSAIQVAQQFPCRFDGAY